VDSEFGTVPQSYTGKEPATRRAIRNEYDPYIQVFNRLEQYVVMNKIPNKIEMIVMGGTFLSFPLDYREDTTYYLYKAMNDFSDLFFTKTGELDHTTFNEFFLLPGTVDDEERTEKVIERIKRQKTKNITSVTYPTDDNIEFEQFRNQHDSHIKCVGLTVETRPDYAYKEQIDYLLRMGCTRVELGVQSTDDDVLAYINRGHSVSDTKKAIALLRDHAYKLNFHMMLGLFQDDRTKDIAMIEKIFSDPSYRPDMLKLYPCMVMKGTQLHDYYSKGSFRPLETEEAINLLKKIIPLVPEYCRIMRIQRDIPTQQTVAGVNRTNLRQMVENEMEKEGLQARDIRAREIGLRMKTEKRSLSSFGEPKLKVDEYDAADGTEYFISFVGEDNVLFGFCRLRLPPRTLRPEITEQSALLRELHVYGKQIATTEKTHDAHLNLSQHKGLGRLLMQKAEEIAKEHNRTKMIVISGIGVRNYYAKLGYEKEGPYMVKYIE
jgi:elongator complex protein 3